MVTTVVSTTAQLDSVFRAAAPGDIIELASGNYDEWSITSGSGLVKNAGDEFATAMTSFFTTHDAYRDAQRAAPGTSMTAPEFTPNLATIFAANVIIRPQDRNNPPIWQGQWLTLDGVQGVTFDGLLAIGNRSETSVVVGGVTLTAPEGTYPAGDKILNIENHKNLVFTNCTMRFHRNQMWWGAGQNFVFQYNDLSQCGIDNCQWYAPVDNAWVHHNFCGDPKIWYDADRNSNRHPDAFQCRSNSGDGWICGRHTLFEDNLFVFDNRSGKPIFFANPRVTGGGAGSVYNGPPGDVNEFGYLDIVCRRNSLHCARYHALMIQGTVGAVIEGNRIRIIEPLGAGGETPGLNLWGYNVDTLIKNNVAPRNFGKDWGDGPSVDNKVVTANGLVISSSADPSGWVDLVRGVNVGPYTGGGSGPTQPTQLTEEWANPPTNTVGKDGRIAATEELVDNAGWFTGVAVVPLASDGYAAAENPANWRWRSGSLVGGFTTANPPTNASSSRRLRMTGGDELTLAQYARQGGGTISAIELGYRNGPSSPWSEFSSYTGTFTAPGSPPVDGTLPALQAGEWTMFGDVYAAPGLAGRYMKNLKVTGVTYTGLQWTVDGETAWRNLEAVGEDSGATIWKLLPADASDDKHTAAYGETRSLRVRYSVGADFSAQSATAKSFTAPARPSPISPYSEGDLLTVDGANVTIAGFTVAIPVGNRPVPLSADQVQVSETAGTVTVTLPPTPPPGAAGQAVFYAGAAHFATDGIVTFDKVDGERFGLVRSFDDTGRVSPALYFFIPITAPEVTDEGEITSTGVLGKIGSEHKVEGFTFEGPGTPSYQWWRIPVSLVEVPIEDATAATYTPVDDDDACSIKRVTTITWSGGTVESETPEQAITWPEPTITDAGSISGDFEVGATLTHSGLVVTGDGWSALIVWTANTTPIAGAPSGATYGPIPASLVGQTIGVNITVINTGGEDTASVAGSAVVESAPVAGSDQDWDETEGTGIQSFDVKPYFTGTGLSYAIDSGGDGVTITDGVLFIDAGAAAAIGGVGPVVDQAIVVEATNTGGSDSLTVTLNVAERALGPELVQNGEFTTDTTSWGGANSAVLTSSSGMLRVTSGGIANGQARQTPTVETGLIYRFKVTFGTSTVTSGTPEVRVGKSTGTSQYFPAGIEQTDYLDFTATQAALYLTVNNPSVNAGEYFEVDNISVKAWDTATTVPAALTVGQWTATNAGAVTGDKLTVAIATAPDDGGSAITEYRYRINGGAWASFSPAVTAAGQSGTVTCPTWETSATVEVQAVNAVGGGPASDAKAATPQFGSSAKFISGSGNDTTGTGTYANPWRTLNKLISASSALTAGQVGYGRPGTYAPASFANSGTAGNEIHLTTLPGEEHLAIVTGTGVGAQLGGGIHAAGKSYLRVSNWRVANIQGVGFGMFGASGVVATDITLDNNQVDTTSNAGIYCAGMSMPPGNTAPAGEFKMRNLTITNNDVTNTNANNGTNECITIGNGTDGFEIAFNHVHDSQQYGIDAKLGAQNGAIHDNYVHDLEKHGIYLDCSCRELYNIDVYNNKVHDCGDNGITLCRESERGDDHGHYENIDKIAIWNNEFVRCKRGILIYRHVFEVDDITEMFVDNATATDFDINESLLGGTSGARRTIVAVYPLTATTFRLLLRNIAGKTPANNGTAYIDNEIVTCSGGSAQVNGTPTTGLPNGISNIYVGHNSFIDSRNTTPGGYGYEFNSSIAAVVSDFTFANNIIHGNAKSPISGFTSTPGWISAGNVTSDPTYTNRNADPPDLTISGGSTAAGAGNASYDPLSALGTHWDGTAVTNTDINGDAYAVPPSAGAREV